MEVLEGNEQPIEGNEQPTEGNEQPIEGNEQLTVIEEEEEETDKPRDISSLTRTQPLPKLKKPPSPNRGKRPPTKPLYENSDKICKHSLAIKDKEMPQTTSNIATPQIKPAMMRSCGPLILPRMQSAPLGDIEPPPVVSKKLPNSSSNLPLFPKETNSLRESSPKRLTKSKSETYIDKEEESYLRIMPNVKQDVVNFRVIGTEFINIQESDEHTAYVIQVDDGDERRSVSRRYAQFRVLYRDLPKASKVKKPSPPRKHYFRRYTGSVIQERINAFNELCEYICTHKLYTCQIVLQFLDPNFSFPLI